MYSNGEEDIIKLAAEKADVSVTRYKTYFDFKSQDRKFSPGDGVLVLLPDNSSKLCMSWSGPYKILEQRNRVNYLIDEKGKAKLYHVNMLKQYFRRSVVVQAVDDNVEGVANSCEPDYFKIVQICLEDSCEKSKPIFPDGRIIHKSWFKKYPNGKPECSIKWV